jgi:hypothetical protein
MLAEIPESTNTTMNDTDSLNEKMTSPMPRITAEAITL